MEGMHTVGGLIQKDKYHLYVHFHVLYSCIYLVYNARIGFIVISTFIYVLQNVIVC
jgi:hypothetical protein